MQKFKIALVALLLFSLSGCANSRLRKDFVGMFKSDWPARQSPFAQKCEQAGEKLADGVNKVGSKFDDCPIEERSGQAVDQAKRQQESLSQSAQKVGQEVKKEAKETTEKLQQKGNSLCNWLKK